MVKNGKTYLSLEEARKKRFGFDWKEYQVEKPNHCGIEVFEDYPVEEIRKFIDWTPFFTGWGLKGKYPKIFEKGRMGEEAKRIFDEGNQMLDRIIEEKLLTPRAIIGLYPANSKDDDIYIYEDDSRTHIIKTIHMLRQQIGHKDKDHFLALSDFIAPVNSGIKDYFGGFAVTAGMETEAIVKSYKEQGDDYNSIMFRFITDRLAEAYAELMHLRIRKEYWGYNEDEKLSNEELIKEKYPGIRPAPGYPACPDHSLKEALFDLLDIENKTGIRLTPEYGMQPASSVAGFYLAHPESKYFGVGKISKDQVNDYANRKGVSIEEAERLLHINLDYSPDK